MAEIYRDKRYASGQSGEGVRTLEEPMEATLADSGGLARLTWSISGSREAGETWLLSTIEFVGFGVQVFLEDPLLRFDQVRSFAQDVWRVADRQEGEVTAVFEPHMKVRIRAPSKMASRLDVSLEFEMGTDATVSARMQSEGTLALAFVEALDRALEAVEDQGQIL